MRQSILTFVAIIVVSIFSVSSFAKDIGNKLDLVNPPLFSAKDVKNISDAMNGLYQIKFEFISVLAGDYRTANEEDRSEILDTVSIMDEQERFNILTGVMEIEEEIAKVSKSKSVSVVVKYIDAKLTNPKSENDQAISIEVFIGNKSQLLFFQSSSVFDDEYGKKKLVKFIETSLSKKD